MSNPASGTIQEIAFKLAEAKQLEQLERDDLQNEATIFVLGSQQVGKTTIIDKFLDKEPSSTVRPTLALEYSFARRSTSSTALSGAGTDLTHQARPVCHVWELGGSLLSSNSQTPDAQQVATVNNNLCDIPMRSARRGLRQMRIVLVADLSQPDRLWSDLTGALQRVEVALRKCAKDQRDYEAAQTKRWQLAVAANAGEDDGGMDKGVGVAEDASQAVGVMSTHYFPVPLLLIGGKYDVFKNFDPEIKKHVCRALRSVALLLGASALLFVSTQSAPQMANVRDWLNRFAFRANTGGGMQSLTGRGRRQATVVDHNEALSIAAGQDSWQQIGHMPKQTMAEVGVMLGAHIPPRDGRSGGDQRAENAEEDAQPDPATDANFREAIVDEIRSQRDAELRERLRNLDVREKFHAMASSFSETSSDF